MRLFNMMTGGVAILLAAAPAHAMFATDNLENSAAAVPDLPSIDPFASARQAEARDDYAEALTAYIRVLASNPRNVRALVGAGKSAVKVGDAEAAVGFLARADELQPRSGPTKAGLAAALVMMDRPRDALPLFDEAERLGVRDIEMAGDRGLAYDLIGDPVRAQKEYALALKNGSDSETVRRLAISQGAAGKMAVALNTLEPLLRKQDRAAWRDRAFIIAMSGDTRAAQQSAALILPPSQVNVLAPYLSRMPSLTPTERMRAVHFGIFPDTGNAASPETLAMIEEGSAQGLVPTGTPLGKPGTATPNAQTEQERTRRELEAAIAVRTRAQAEAAARARAEAEARARVAAEAAARQAEQVRQARLAAAADTARTTEQDRQQPGAADNEAETARRAQAERLARALSTTTPTASRTNPVQTVAAASAPAAPTAPAKPANQFNSRVAAQQADRLQIALPELRPEDEQPVAPSAAVVALASQKAPMVMRPTPTASTKPGTDKQMGDKQVADKPVAKPLDKPSTKTADKAAVECTIDPKAKKGSAKATPGCNPKTAAKDQKDAKGKELAKADCKPDPKAKKGSKAQVCEEPKPVCKPDPKGKKGKNAKSVPCDDKAIREADAKGSKAGKDAKDSKDSKDAKDKGGERYWVQVASGPNKADLGKAFSAVKAKAPALLGSQSTWTSPWRGSNRLLVGPFSSADDAQAFVNKLTGKGVSGIQFTSRSGVAVDRLSLK
jgi:Flp pilus assembly protein TadD